jgi:hypothetical protein
MIYALKIATHKKKNQNKMTSPTLSLFTTYIFLPLPKFQEKKNTHTSFYPIYAFIWFLHLSFLILFAITSCFAITLPKLK